MRSLQITGKGQPLEARECSAPVPGHGEVLLRIEAAGICRSDVHYRSGTRPVPALPVTPGHEIAGTVDAVGDDVDDLVPGDRVGVHYLITCGNCRQCRSGAEQFCSRGEMVGLDRDGGYAESIVIPAVNAVPIPEQVSTRAAAVMMCSTATAFHALRRGAARAGDSVAIFGVGGLGMSAVQLAMAMGASTVFAVDVNPAKLAVAEQFGAVGVDGRDGHAGDRILARFGGADIALELVGLAKTMRGAVESLRPGGRAVAVGITEDQMELNPFRDLVLREVSMVGAADHLFDELRVVLDMAARAAIDVDAMVTSTVPLDADTVNTAMDRLEGFGDDIRTVIVPDRGAP